MKKISILFLLVWTAASARGQALSDSVSLGAGYSHQSYYKLSSGEVALVDNTNWDLAFDASGFGSTIRYNAQNGVELYGYPHGDSSAWASLDTAGMAGWAQLHDADTSWSQGAFNRTANASDPFDLGWGMYNSTTHHVVGDSLYVLRLASGAVKKLRILRLASNAYQFRHANLDGSGEASASISKADFAGKNFAYYSIQNDLVLDREPAAQDWDIVFTKYVTELAPGVYYGVTGVLQNNARPAATAYPVANPSTYQAHASHPFSTQINAVGYDWKTFNNQTFQYEILDSLCYFIEDLGGNIWRVLFTGFAGSSSGDIHFEKELVAAVSVDELASIQAFGLYPNPAQGDVTLAYDLRTRGATVTIRDLRGQSVRRETLHGQGFNRHGMDLGGLKPGVYLVSLEAGNETSHQKLIIH